MENEHLSDAERAQMQGHLRVFMSEHPARAPFTLSMLDRVEVAAKAVATAFARPRMQLAGALSLALVFVGAGTSYAAESSLPGDALYAVKIHVNEKVAAALAVGPSSRAGVLAVHTLRRIQEAETLAAQGRLSASVSSDIRAALQDTEMDFDASVDAVAQTPGGAAAAADLQSNLEVTLSSHARALTLMQERLPQSEESLTPILAAVVARAAHARQAGLQEDTLIAASSSPGEASVVANKERRNARDALAKVRLLVETAKKDLGTTSAAAVARHASAAEESVHEGEKHLEEGDPARATGAFRAAIRTAVQTQIDADTEAPLQKILPQLSATLSGFEATTTESSDIHLEF